MLSNSETSKVKTASVPEEAIKTTSDDESSVHSEYSKIVDSSLDNNF